MNKDRKNNSVSFNLLDPEEVEWLEHAEQVNPLTGRKRNFSKYVKRLIRDDFERNKRPASNNNANNHLIINSPHDDDDSDDYKSFL